MVSIPFSQLFFKKDSLGLFYGMSHWSVARDESDEIGPQNVGIIHVLYFNGTGILGGETINMHILCLAY